MNLKSAILGLTVGDALGVPVEFMHRSNLQKDPVVSMRAFGTHHQPKGTWSDDSSMTFCLMETLCKDYNLDDLAQRFVNWYRQGYWTAHGTIFDMGKTTRQAILRLEEQDIQPQEAGSKDIQSNGNGSLMRILPLVFFIQDKSIEERWQYTKDVSSMTHGHFTACFACFIYLEYARLLLQGTDKLEAYAQMVETIHVFVKQQNFSKENLQPFHRILQATPTIAQLPQTEIQSSGYVLHSLEASFWCLLKEETYANTVLAAVNLGADTDTTATITGGLAGIVYGADAIPPTWIAYLTRLDDIIDLINRLQKKLDLSSS